MSALAPTEERSTFAPSLLSPKSDCQRLQCDHDCSAVPNEAGAKILCNRECQRLEPRPGRSTYSSC